jgi:hypothetical protein
MSESFAPVKTDNVDFCEVENVESDFNFSLNGLTGDEEVNDLDMDKMKELMREVLVWAKKCEELRVAYNSATGDTKNAYALVHRDFLWKIQRKVGRLWFYICGSKDMSPFDSAV